MLDRGIIPITGPKAEDIDRVIEKISIGDIELHADCIIALRSGAILALNPCINRGDTFLSVTNYTTDSSYCWYNVCVIDSEADVSRLRGARMRRRTQERLADLDAYIGRLPLGFESGLSAEIAEDEVPHHVTAELQVTRFKGSLRTAAEMLVSIRSSTQEMDGDHSAGDGTL